MVVGICTGSLRSEKQHFAPHSMYAFPRTFTINSDSFPKHHKPNGFTSCEAETELRVQRPPQPCVWRFRLSGIRRSVIGQSVPDVSKDSLGFKATSSLT